MDYLALPKIELHAHLSGSISRQCLHELWLRKSQQGETTLEDPLIEMPDGKFDYDLETFFPLFSRYIYNLCNDLPSLIFTTNAVLKDFEKDGVVYLELRTTPRAMPAAGLTKDGYVTSILECISKFNEISPTMKTNLILSIDRRNDLATAMEVVRLADRYRHQGVVGVDLCGDPSVGDTTLFAPAFQLARQLTLPITIHFAEIPSDSSTELLTLLSYEPARIGHVIHVPDALRQVIAERKIGLELCLSCNVHAKMFTGSFADHHFGYWRGKECPIAISTDDVGVFGSPLSNEYALVAQHFNLDRQEIISLAQSAIDIIFGGEEEKARLRGLDWSSSL